MLEYYAKIAIHSYCEASRHLKLDKGLLAFHVLFKHPQKQHHRMCSALLCKPYSSANGYDSPITTALLLRASGKVCLGRQVRSLFEKPWVPSVSEKHRGRFRELLTSLGRLPGQRWQTRRQQEAAECERHPGLSGAAAPPGVGGTAGHSPAGSKTTSVFPDWTQAKWKISAFSILHLSSEI